MELKYQYNKTALNELKGQLLLRETALPILKNKETALRQEVKNTLKDLKGLNEKLDDIMNVQSQFERIWQEFPSIVSIEKLQIDIKKIIGVSVPEVTQINFSVKEMSWFNQRAWIPAGVLMLKKILKLKIRIRVTETQLQLLYQARKKTTQKVNLYEKVQIPQLETAILKIKRFLEDEENIAKAAQKIVKKRNELKGIMT